MHAYCAETGEARHTIKTKKGAKNAERATTIRDLRANNWYPINKIWERFWSKVDVQRDARCWNWKGSKDEFGYGRFRMPWAVERAPRLAFLSRNGYLPENACHKCDNPSCCNPAHIFSGTAEDNMRDMVSKGRGYTHRGEAHPGHVLTADQVLEMRREYAAGGISMAKLGKKYACSYAAARDVVNQKSWRTILPQIIT